jgi:hypothetical protein
MSPSLDLRTEIHPVSETLCFPVFRILDDGQSPENPVILSVIHHRQGPSDSADILTTAKS